MVHAVVNRFDACETITAEISELMVEAPAEIAPLTNGEEQVLTRIGQGLPNTTISTLLSLSEHTMNTQRRKISRKLGRSTAG